MSTTDRELLELAAKAAGMQLDSSRPDRPLIFNAHGEQEEWSPLDDDGDAFRLAVACGLVVDTSRPTAGEPFKPHWCGQEDFVDRGAATRRAIVRAAAAIGRAA